MVKKDINKVREKILKYLGITAVLLAMSVYGISVLRSGDPDVYIMDRYLSDIEFVQIPKEKLCVNINTAELEELTKLNGIGDSKAKAIIAYREENGDFVNIEDIMKVSGIKNTVFSKIKDNITVNSEMEESNGDKGAGSR